MGDKGLLSTIEDYRNAFGTRQFFPCPTECLTLRHRANTSAKFCIYLSGKVANMIQNMRETCVIRYPILYSLSSWYRSVYQKLSCLSWDDPSMGFSYSIMILMEQWLPPSLFPILLVLNVLKWAGAYCSPVCQREVCCWKTSPACKLTHCYIHILLHKRRDKDKAEVARGETPEIKKRELQCLIILISE